MSHNFNDAAERTYTPAPPEPRQATGTPIGELFDHNDRIAALESNVTALERKVDHLYRMMMTTAQVQIMQGNRLMAIERTRKVPEPLGELLP